ncbi:MFS transporter [Thermodesulfitimonas sp.]
MWLLFLAGLGMTTFASTVNTLVQLAVVDEFRGRVMSLYVIFFVGTTPVGNFLVGTIAHRWGVPTAFAIGGGAALFLGILTTLWWWRAKKRGAGFVCDTT